MATNNLAEKYNIEQFLPQEKKKKKHSTKAVTNVVSISKNMKKIIAANFLLFFLCATLLALRAQGDKLSCQIAEVKNNIEIAESENVRLESEYAAKCSSRKIEDYATKELGMVKAESYQITYIDLSEGDKILVSGNKTLSEENEFWETIKDVLNPENW